MSRRDQIHMTEQEVASFIERGRSLAVATINPDGAPHMVAMWYTLVDGKIAFWTYAKSQKAVNLRRDPRLTCLLETGERYEELRGVQIHGVATLIADVEVVRTIGESVYRRYAAGALTPENLRTIAAQAPKRVAVFVEPTSVVSWDHAKLGGVR
ncbi:MAG TPA: PPOX class F420-dependent oxidoreductase [Ktedonobacterales bacterium]